MAIKRKPEGLVRTKADLRQFQIPPEIPVLFMVSQVVFPFGATLVQIHTASNLALLDELTGDALIAVAFAPGVDPSRVTKDDVGKVGVAARVIDRLKLPDGTEQVTLQGLMRIYLDEVVQEQPYMRARAACVVEDPGDAEAVKRQVERVLSMMTELAGLTSDVQPEHVLVMRSNQDDPGHFADLVAALVPFDLPLRRKLIEKVDVPGRLTYVSALLREKLESARLATELDDRVRKDINDTQREFFLRRQLKLLREELGEESREQQAAKEAAARLAEIRAPAEVEAAAKVEIDRLGDTNPASAEFGVIQTYLDWLLEIPWSNACTEVIDLETVRAALDADHYGLHEPKQRILEYLAVRKLSPDAPTPILCLVGPPGTGKTSLAQSIASVIGRALVRISVGGVRDEAEIRGHRRTYVGAMPGRIVQALRRVGCNNPLMVVDEIDKMSSGIQGDPTAAMLEVLDPEQNSSFRDHYLGVPVDLSSVFFITTANTWWEIPEPLRDRMEMIELSTYVEEEKVEIARRHLVPKLVSRTGMPKSLKFGVKALRAIIRGYTVEAGVRELSRRIESVLRKIAVGIAADGATAPRTVTDKMVAELLGPPIHLPPARLERNEVGVANGLAWTSAGGDVLLIEGVRMPGEGQIQMTGSLGEVMRESVAAALTYVRSRADDLGIDPDDFTNHDVHIHFPEGATPKDGPSAGVTVAVVLASLFTGRAVRARVAMTGEITLRGEVLPVGGVREKLAAAARLGMRTVTIPQANEGDLHKLRESVKKKLRIVPVTRVEQVLDEALVKRRAARPD